MSSASHLFVVALVVSVTTSFPLRRPQRLQRIREIREPEIGQLKRLKDPVPILSMESENSEDGSFRYSYETGDGTKAEQIGKLKDFGEGRKGTVSYGAYEFVGDDGRTYKITYTADENGFQPKGAHLPKGPPVREPVTRDRDYPSSQPRAPAKYDDYDE